MEKSKSRTGNKTRNTIPDQINAEELQTLEREIEGLTTLLIESKKLHELKQTSAYSQIKQLEEQLKHLSQGPNANLGASSPRKRKLADFSRTLDLFMTVKSQTLDELERVQFDMLRRQESLSDADPVKVLSSLRIYENSLEHQQGLKKENPKTREYIKSLIERLSKVTRLDAKAQGALSAREAHEEPISFRDNQDDPEYMIKTAEQLLEALESMKVPGHLKEIVDQIEVIDELIEQMNPSDKDQASLITDEVYSLIQKFAPNEHANLEARRSDHVGLQGSRQGGRVDHSEVPRSAQILNEDRNMENEKARLLDALEKKKLMKKANQSEGPKHRLEDGGSPNSPNLTLKSPVRSPLGQRDQNLTPVGVRRYRDLHLDSTPYGDESNKRLTTTQITRPDVPLVDPAPYMKIIEQYERQATKDRKWIDGLKKEIEERVGNVLKTQQENEVLKKHNHALRKKIVDLEEDLKSYSSRWSGEPEPLAVREVKVHPRATPAPQEAKLQTASAIKAVPVAESRQPMPEAHRPSDLGDPRESSNGAVGSAEEEDRRNKKLILKLERGLAKVLETSSKLLETALETHPASHEISRKTDLVDRMLSTLMALIFERRTEGQFAQQPEEEKRLPSREHIGRRDVRQTSLSPRPDRPPTASEQQPTLLPATAARPSEVSKPSSSEWKEVATQELCSKLTAFTQAVCGKSDRLGELQRANGMMDRRVKALLDRVAEERTDQTPERRPSAGRAQGQNARLRALEEFLNSSPLPSFAPRVSKQTQRAFDAMEEILSCYSKYARQLKEVTVDRKNLLEKILLDHA